MQRTPSSLAAEFRRTNQTYELAWAGGGQLTVQGRAVLAARLGIAEASLPVLFSRGQGHGRAFTLRRANPVTGDPDIVTITKVGTPTPPSNAAPKPSKPRGRPPKSTT